MDSAPRIRDSRPHLITSAQIRPDAAWLHFGVSPFRFSLHCIDKRDHY